MTITCMKGRKKIGSKNWRKVRQRKWQRELRERKECVKEGEGYQGVRSWWLVIACHWERDGEVMRAVVERRGARGLDAKAKWEIERLSVEGRERWMGVRDDRADRWGGRGPRRSARECLSVMWSSSSWWLCVKPQTGSHTAAYRQSAYLHITYQPKLRWVSDDS